MGLLCGCVPVQREHGGGVGVRRPAAVACVQSGVGGGCRRLPGRLLADGHLRLPDVRRMRPARPAVVLPTHARRRRRRLPRRRQPLHHLPDRTLQRQVE